MPLSIHSKEAKDLIIHHLLKQVSLDGWTPEALEKATQEAGFEPQQALQAFQGSMDRVVAYYLDYIDQQMTVHLEGLDLTHMKVRDRIATAIMLRLRLLESHRDAVRKSLAYLSVPFRHPLALKSLYETVDKIWYAAGDQATDFNYYSKRFLLAGVYSATLLYWLEDTSEDATQTRAYLDRRLEQVLMIPQTTQLVTESVKASLQKLSRVFTDFKQS